MSCVKGGICEHGGCSDCMGEPNIKLQEDWNTIKITTVYELTAEEIAYQLLEDNYEDKSGMLERCKKLAKAYLDEK